MLNNIKTNRVIINMYLEILFIKIGSKHWKLILLQLKKLLIDFKFILLQYND